MLNESAHWVMKCVWGKMTKQVSMFVLDGIHKSKGVSMCVLDEFTKEEITKGVVCVFWIK